MDIVLENRTNSILSPSKAPSRTAYFSWRTIDLLRKSRHAGNGAVTHRRNEIDAYREAPPPVTVNVLQHAENLQTPDDMLDPQAGRRQFPVLLTLFRGQGRFLRRFVRCHRVTVMLPNALVAGVADQRRLWVDLDARLPKQGEVMHRPEGGGDAQDHAGGHVDHDLRFEGVPFLLAAVPAALFAGGPLTGGFSGIHSDDLKDVLFLFEALAARKSKLSAVDQGSFDALHRALHGGFVNVPVVADVSKGAVFPPEFEGEEELLRSVEGGRATGLFLGAFSLVQDEFHLGEGFGVDPGVPFEPLAIQFSEAFQTVVAHSRRVAGDFRRRSNFTRIL